VHRFVSSFAACLVCAAGALAAPPNVVLLSVDTLRADHLGCYGYDKPTSPNIDRFAAEGMLFEDVVCEVPLTAPSFGAMLTSRYPRMNATTRNGLRLPDGAFSAVQAFQKSGYETYAVLSNWTLKAKLSGIERGFDIYDDDFHEKRWGLIKPERSGDDVTALALDWLAKRDAAKPFFAWIHYSDPHAPYELHKDFPVWKQKFYRLGKADKVRAKYDSEIAYTDAQIAQVLAALPENTYVLFVSDHGESIYEHGYLGHGRRIYQNNMHIACIVRGPGIAPGRSKLPASGIDIGPTLLGLGGLERPPTMLGIDLLRDSAPLSRPRVFETYGGAVLNLPGVKDAMADSPPMRQGVILDGWKLIIDGKREELFYLPNDRGELKNLAKREKGRVAEMRRLIDEWEIAHPEVHGEGLALDEADIEALRSLGYTE